MNYNEIIKKEIQTKQYRKIFSDILESEQEQNKENTLNYILNGYNSYLEHKSLMKNEFILLENFFKEGNTLSAFENFNDTVQKSILNNKAKKLKKRIISNKYKNLCNKQTDELFLEMALMDFTKKELQDFVGKKISAFTYPEELNGALMNLIDLKGLDNYNALKEKIDLNELKLNKDYDLSYNEDNTVILDIKTYKAAAALGSKMWCIAREERMFEFYKEKQYTDFQFLYDFNKEASEDDSMVAILNDVTNEAYEIYTKSDAEIFNNDEDENSKKLKKHVLDIKNKSFNEKDSNPASIVKKLKAYQYPIDGNVYKTEDELFNPTNQQDLTTYLEFGKLEGTITQKDIDDNPDLFMPVKLEKDIYTLDTEPASWILEERCEYTSDFIEFLEKDTLSDKGLRTILNSDIYSGLMTYHQKKAILFLSKNKDKFEILDEYLQNEKRDNFFEVYRYSDYLSENELVKVLLNKEYIEHLKEENLLDSIINKHNLDNSEVLKKVLLLSIEHENEIDHLDDIFPTLKNKVYDFKDFDYSKKLHMNKFIRKDSSMYKFFDFKNDGTDTDDIKALVSTIDETLIARTMYNSVTSKNIDIHLNHLENIEKVHEDRLELIKSKDDDFENKKESEVQKMSQLEKLLLGLEQEDDEKKYRFYNKTNPFDFVSRDKMINGVNSISFLSINKHYELEKEENTKQREGQQKTVDDYYYDALAKIEYTTALLSKRSDSFNINHLFENIIYNINTIEKDGYKLEPEFKEVFSNILLKYEETGCINIAKDLENKKKKLKEFEDLPPFWKMTEKIVENKKNKIDKKLFI